jgi:hypothetical protein
MNPLGGVVPESLGKEEVGETVGETGCGGDDNELLLVTPKKECEAPPPLQEKKKEKKKKGTTRSRLMSVVRQTSRKSKFVQPTIQKVANVQFKN